jgi:hypothetical protein
MEEGCERKMPLGNHSEALRRRAAEVWRRSLHNRQVMARRASKGGLRPPRGLGGAEPPGSEWNAAKRVVGAATERRRELARCRAPPERRSGATTPHAGTAQASLRGASARRGGRPRHWGRERRAVLGAGLQRNAWEVAAGRAAERGRRARHWRPGRAGAANGAQPPSLRRKAARPSDASARRDGHQRGQRLPWRAVNWGVLH